jgi:glycosyltransferase involved in cell wall biosynthesis
MRILHVIPTLNPAGCGPVEGLKRLAVAEMKLGRHVEVLTLDDPAAQWLRDLPFGVHPIGPGKLGYGYAPKLVPWLREHHTQYDAVIVEGLWQYHCYGVWKALRGMATPYYVFTHGMLDPWFKHTYPVKHLKKWLYWPWGQYPVLRDAKAVLFTCEEERILARQSFWLYRANEVVVGYGTARPAGDSAAQRGLFLSGYPELRGKRVFLFLGRIHEKKGCDLLIEAFARFAKQDEALRLVMAGPDQMGWKRNLVSLGEGLGIGDRITWTGMISGDLKWGAYHAAEAFILPSHQENFGVVVAEALACGVPVLISSRVNIWREVAADGAGIVAEDTLAGTVELFEEWLGMDGAARAAMRGSAAACFSARFEVDRAARNLANVISQEANDGK